MEYGLVTYYNLQFIERTPRKIRQNSSVRRNGQLLVAQLAE